MIFLRIFLATVIFAGFVFKSQSAEGVKPLAPLVVNLELQGTPQVGSEVQVLVKVRAILDAPKVKIRCILPEGVTLISGEDNWEGEMAAGSLKEMLLILRPDEPGQHLIRAMATIEYPGGAKISKGETLSIDLGSASDSKSNTLGTESNQAEKKQKVKPDQKRRPLIRKGKDGQDIGEFPLDE
jgi:hypothetical protein